MALSKLEKTLIHDAYNMWCKGQTTHHQLVKFLYHFGFPDSSGTIYEWIYYHAGPEKP